MGRGEQKCVKVALQSLLVDWLVQLGDPPVPIVPPAAAADEE